jgi:deoxyhypusine synthase
MATEEETLVASAGALLGVDYVDSNQVVLKEAPLAHTNTVSAKPHIPSVSASSVLGESISMPAGSTPCRGFDFNTCPDSSNNDSNNVALDALLSAFSTTGFQASNLGDAVEQIKLMRQWRLSDTHWNPGDDEELKPPHVRRRIRARIFLGYTSNQISCGQREVIRYLVQHKMVDVIVTTAGGVEEDIIKCFQPTFMGDFKLNGRELRKKGINRIGNLLVSNYSGYCATVRTDKG